MAATVTDLLPLRHGRTGGERGPVRGPGRPEPAGHRRAARRRGAHRARARGRPPDQPAGRVAPPAPAQGGGAGGGRAAGDAAPLPPARRRAEGGAGLPRAGLGRRRRPLPPLRGEHVTEPLRMAFEVACPVDRAFAAWASETGRWWPPSNTVTGAAGRSVQFESRAGGRTFERGPGGEEHDWGWITAWKP